VKTSSHTLLFKKPCHQYNPTFCHPHHTT